MPLSPIDVQQKTFRVALRGYAEDEVDEFLDEIVVSIREYEQRIEELSYQVGSLEAQLVENRQTEEAMRRTLLLAERTADEITEEARREAERILSEARTEAKALSAEQNRERDGLIEELNRLREIVTDVRERLTDVAGRTLESLRPIAGDINDTLDRVEEDEVAEATPLEPAEAPATPPWAAAAIDGDEPVLAGEAEEAADSLDEGSAWASDDNPDEFDDEDVDYWTSSSPRASRWSDQTEAGAEDDVGGGYDELRGHAEDAVTGEDTGETDETDDVGDTDDTDDGGHRDVGEPDEDVADAEEPVEDGDSGTRRRPWERFGD